MALHSVFLVLELNEQTLTFERARSKCLVRLHCVLHGCAGGERCQSCFAAHFVSPGRWYRSANMHERTKGMFPKCRLLLAEITKEHTATVCATIV
eukprot:3616909-Amphidinium_carterae.1